MAASRGEPVAGEVLVEASLDATRAVIARQLECGLDIINNGEAGRESFFTYLQHRMSGFGGRASRSLMADLTRYPEYLEQLQRVRGARERVDLMQVPQAQAPVRYRGREAIDSECMTLGRLLEAAAEPYAEAFVSSPSPGIVAAAMQNAYYPSLDDYLRALGDALRVEYHAIVEHGFMLQIDAPDLALERHTLFQDKPLSDFLEFARRVVGEINRALDGLPPERVRLHVCWGNYEGPHDCDVALADIWPEVKRAKVGAFMLSMGNPRHAHEYRLFESLQLPVGSQLVAGVIDTTTNYIEHPETVADRIERVAKALGEPERIVAGTDCGFETSAGTSNVVAEVAWAKLRALAQGARLASHRVFGA